MPSALEPKTSISCFWCSKKRRIHRNLLRVYLSLTQISSSLYSLTPSHIHENNLIINFLVFKERRNKNSRQCRGKQKKFVHSMARVFMTEPSPIVSLHVMFFLHIYKPRQPNDCLLCVYSKQCWIKNATNYREKKLNNKNRERYYFIIISTAQACHISMARFVPTGCSIDFQARVFVM